MALLASGLCIPLVFGRFDTPFFGASFVILPDEPFFIPFDVPFDVPFEIPFVVPLVMYEVPLASFEFEICSGIFVAPLVIFRVILIEVLESAAGEPDSSFSIKKLYYCKTNIVNMHVKNIFLPFFKLRRNTIE